LGKREEQLWYVARVNDRKGNTSVRGPAEGNVKIRSDGSNSVIEVMRNHVLGDK
jgi:hypothetical protein